jgi:hypothetical protein
MEERSDDDRPSRLQVRTSHEHRVLAAGGDPSAHLLTDAVWPYGLRTDDRHRMWLPEVSEPMDDHTLPGDLADLFAEIKRKVKRVLLG